MKRGSGHQAAWVSPMGITRWLIVLAMGLVIGMGGYLWSRASGWNAPLATREAGKVDIREMLAAGIQLARAAGERIVEIRKGDDLGQSSKGSLQNSVDDPLTKADMESHQILVSHFRSIWPEVTVVSEEKDAVTKSPYIDINLHSLSARLSPGMVDPKDVRIWVDPLDATKEFTESLTQYVTVLVGIVVKGEPVAGVVHFPFEEHTMWGWVGHSTSFTPASESANKEAFRVIVSRSHAGDIESNAAAMGVESVTPAGGAGYKVAEVLRGHQDAYLHNTLIKKWDLCAGDALLRAAGGRLTDWAGRSLDYSSGEEALVTGGVAAALHNHEKLVSKLAQFDLEKMTARNRPGT